MLLKIRRRRQRGGAARKLFSCAVNLYLLSYFEGHQVFAHFQGSGICFSRLSDKVRDIDGNNVRIDRQLWLDLAEDHLDLAEDHPRLFRSSVMCDYLLLALGAEKAIGCGVGLRVDDLMN